MSKVRTIGLLGGMSWESSVLYERLINEAEKRRNQVIPRAEGEALQIIAEAEAGAADLHRTLEIDRELVKERLDSLEAREADAAAKLAEADRTLEHARSEAERMTTEAGEAVDAVQKGVRRLLRP